MKRLGLDAENLDLFLSYCTVIRLIRDSIATRKIENIKILDQRRSNLHKRLLKQIGCRHPEKHDELPSKNCEHEFCLKYIFSAAVEETLADDDAGKN